MPRRRLSERQLARIQRIQERRRSKAEARSDRVIEELETESPQTGRIVVRYGSRLIVEDGLGRPRLCVTRQHVGHPVCGDRVIWHPAGEGAGVITALEARRNVLSRPHPNQQPKPLAANIDLMVVVIAPQPPPSGFLLDQYLVAAERIGVSALILCNKMDLLDDTERHDFLRKLAPYEAIGYPLASLSLKRTPDLAPLQRQFADKTVILVGQSGVGKSSLVQALLPERSIQVGALSSATGLGRHTTSAATSYALAGGGRLIDSPGVRSFRLGPTARNELEQSFPEFRPHLGKCRFSNCRHQQEPDCAIREASTRGEIAPLRLAAFHQLAKTVATGFV